MAVSNIYGLKSKYRITLEVSALDDFNPHQIDFRKVLQLEGNEEVESIIEDLDNPDQLVITIDAECVCPKVTQCQP